MKYLVWLFRILVFLILFGFAFKNTEPVTLRFYLVGEWQAPLAFVLLVAFALGALAALLASMGMAFRRRRELSGLRKQLREHSQLRPE